jgi:PilZ domain
MTNEERRQARRVPIVLEATWDGSAGIHEARVTDVSMTGCFIDTIGHAARGDMVQLSFRLPNGKLETVRGIVAHRQGHTGFAIAFVELSEEQNEVIAHLLKSTTEDSE